MISQKTMITEQYGDGVTKTIPFQVFNKRVLRNASEYNMSLRDMRLSNRVSFKKQEFKSSIERPKNLWEMKHYMPSYSTGPVFTNFLHEQTVKELKSLNQ